MANQTLGGLVMAGLATELDYMTADAADQARERYDWLMSCDADELAEAAEFIALAVTA